METQNGKAEFEITGDEFVTGFALNAEYVKNLADKSFTIVGQKTVLMPSIDNPTIKEKKISLSVKLADGTIIDYYPNKTSQRAVINKRGFKLDSWIGYAGKLTVMNQQIGAVKRDVIYIEVTP